MVVLQPSENQPLVVRETAALFEVYPDRVPDACSLYEIQHVDAFQWLNDASANCIHAVVTDPPYGLVEYTEKELTKLRNGNGGGIWRIPPSFDGCKRSPLPRFTVLGPDDKDALRRFFVRLACGLMKVLVPGGHIMTVMPRSCWEPWGLFRKPCEGRVQDNLRKWGTGGLRRISRHEPFKDLIQSSPTRPEERSIAPHPSLKPQRFLRQLVRASLPLETGIILDPFMGSGSTIAAAAACGLLSIGLEIDAEYFHIAKTAIPKLAALRA